MKSKKFRSLRLKWVYKIVTKDGRAAPLLKLIARYGYEKTLGNRPRTQKKFTRSSHSTFSEANFVIIALLSAYPRAIPAFDTFIYFFLDIVLLIFGLVPLFTTAPASTNDIIR